MKACLGYNQILIHLEDGDKMIFIAEMPNFYFRVQMPFELNNSIPSYLL